MKLCATRLRTGTKLISAPRKDISLADRLQTNEWQLLEHASKAAQQTRLPVRSYHRPAAASADSRLVQNYPELEAGVSSECRNINNHAKPGNASAVGAS